MEQQVDVRYGIAQPIMLSYWQNCFKTLMLLLMVSFQFSSYAQAPPNPVSFTWENFVGCIEGEQKVRSYEEAVAAGVCHTTCQGSTVIYQLNSNTTLSNTVWTVLGGTILTQSNTSCTVKWSSSLLSGAIGASTFTSTTPIIFNPICVDIAIAPTAVIGRNGVNTAGGTIVVCRNTTVNFNNLSTTNEIIVNEGGPYQVVFTNASGCSAAAQIAVPRSLERYMWIVPTGCFNFCDLRDDNRTLLGPGNIEFAGWDWLINTAPQASGIEAVAPFDVNQSGNYQLQLNNGWCTFRSGRLEVNKLDCRDCKNFLSAELNSIEGSATPFLFYTIDLIITNPTSSPMTVTPTAFVNTGIFSPTTVVAQPGTHSYSFQFIPLGGFLAGPQVISLEFDIQGKTCMIPIKIDFPDVTGRNKSAGVQSVFTIAPNPAAHYTIVTYEFPQASAKSTLELFDMMGRRLDRHQCDALSGTWNIDTSSLNPGQYLIVLKQADGTIQQKRLVKKP